MEPQLFASPFQDPSCPGAVCVIEDMTRPLKVNGVGPGGFCTKKPEGWRLCGNKGGDSSPDTQDCVKVNEVERDTVVEHLRERSRWTAVRIWRLGLGSRTEGEILWWTTAHLLVCSPSGGS